ncbi:hypothetical protein JCM6882_009690 [Rhodosporidiobolus microsporus]
MNGTARELETQRSRDTESGDRLRDLNMLEQSGEGAKELPPVDRGRAAWGFVVASFILETFIWGYSFSFATILVYLQGTPPWSENALSSLSAIGSVQLGVQYLLPMGAILVFRRYPEYVKSILWVSAAFNCGGMLVSSWATEVWQLILLQGVVCGLSGSVIYTPVLMWLNDWFVERKGLAGGIIFAGAGIGGFVFPFLIQALLDHVGFHWMVRTWSFITAVVYVVALYLVQPRIPPPKKVRKGERGPWLAVEPKVLLNPILIAMCFASLFASLSTFPVSLYLATYASALTTSSFTSEVVVGVYNVAASLGCAVTGWVSDRNYPLAATLCGGLGALIALTAWGLADTIPKVYGFAVAAGFTSQIIAAWGGCSSDVANGNPYVATLVFGVLSIIRGLASIAMPFVSAGLYHPGEKEGGWGLYGFENMIIFVGVMGGLAAAGGIVLDLVRRDQVKKGLLKPQMRS